MMKIVENNLAEIIIISIFTMCFFSSCGIQNPPLKKNCKKDCCTEVKQSINELEYYVQEDVFNGNLNKEISEFYIIELNKIKEYLVVNCENCDEID